MEADTKRTKGDGHELSKAESRGSVRRRIPLKMFGKKFSSKRLLVSSKVWMHTIPTQDCDIVMTLPAATSDTTLMWLLARLRSRAPHISVHFRHHNNSGIYGFYMTASYDSLLQGAEELGIRKPLKSEFGGGIKEFVLEDQECFEGVGEEQTFLTSQERQSIVHHMLINLRATEGEELNGVRFLEGQPIVPRLKSKNVVSGVFPLHCQSDLLHLRQAWVLSFTQSQPLDTITEYFGVRIGLYFAFLGHYTKWLVFPSLVGVALWLLQGTSQWWEDVTWVMISIVNVFWATLYIVNWKRTSASLAYRWGTLDKKDDLLKDPRPLFKGDLQKSPVTNHLEPYYPAWKRHLFRYCISAPVIFFCLLIVFYTMLFIFELQEWVNELVADNDIPSFLRFGPKVLMALVIAVLDELYKQVAVWLNNKENHRLEETHETNLVLKLVLFVNSFLSLFYIAFYLRDMDRLRETLAALLITRQILGNLKEVLMPLFRWKGKLYSVGYKMAGQMSSRTLDKEVEKVTQVYRRKWYTTTTTAAAAIPGASTPSDITDKVNRKVEKTTKGGAAKATTSAKEEEGGVESDESEDQTGSLTQAEVESAMMEYDNAFEDYLEMVIQFGYVTLFSAAFPLAALCGLLNNLIEIRSDAFKLCYTHQRPFGARVEDIGIWQDVLHIMVLIAVIVNSILIGMGDLVHRMLPELSDTLTVVLVVVVEHMILLIKYAMEYAIPDVPYEVATEMAKVEFQRREALKRLETQGGSSSERSPRGRAPDSPTSGQPSPSSPVPAPRRTVETPTSPPVQSRSSHQSLVGHRPQNFSSNNSQEDRQRGGNPWGPAERGQGSLASRGPPVPYRDSPKGTRRLPSLPTDDRFRNPFEAEVRQVFRQTTDVVHIYRKSDSSPSSSRHVQEGSSDRACPGSSPSPVSRSSLSRGKSLDSELPPSRRNASTPQTPAQQPSGAYVHRDTVSQPKDLPSQYKETVSPPRDLPPGRGAGSASGDGVSVACAVRRRDVGPVSPTAVGVLAGESCVDSAGSRQQSSK